MGGPFWNDEHRTVTRRSQPVHPIGPGSDSTDHEIRARRANTKNSTISDGCPRVTKIRYRTQAPCHSNQPRWARDGRELVYVAADRTLTAVAVRTDTAVQPGAATALFDTHLLDPFSFGLPQYDVAPDGKRFPLLVAKEAAAVPMTVVLNWTAALRK
jgi:hypothetical protein